MKLRVAAIAHGEPGWAQCGVCGGKFPHLGRTVGLSADTVPGHVTLCQPCHAAGPSGVARQLGASSSTFYTLASNAEVFARHLAPLERWPVDSSDDKSPSLAYDRAPADLLTLLDVDVSTIARLDVVVPLARSYATRAQEVLGPTNAIALAIDAHAAWLAQIHDLTRRRVEQTLTLIEQTTIATGSGIDNDK